MPFCVLDNIKPLGLHQELNDAKRTRNEQTGEKQVEQRFCGNGMAGVTGKPTLKNLQPYLHPLNEMKRVKAIYNLPEGRSECFTLCMQERVAARDSSATCNQIAVTETTQIDLLCSPLQEPPNPNAWWLKFRPAMKRSIWKSLKWSRTCAICHASPWTVNI